jgi:hypothetical protein
VGVSQLSLAIPRISPAGPVMYCPLARICSRPRFPRAWGDRLTNPCQSLIEGGGVVRRAYLMCVVRSLGSWDLTVSVGKQGKSLPYLVGFDPPPL